MSEESDYLNEKYILLKDLEKYTFSPGTIKWKEKMTLAQPADVLNHDYFRKFEKVTDRIYCDFVFRPWNVSRFQELLSDFKLAKRFSTKQRCRLKLLKHFHQHYWKGENEGALAEIMESGHQEFFQAEFELLNLVQKNDLLYKTCALKGTVAVVLAVATGLVEYQVLKEVYHLPFFFYSGVLENLTYHQMNSITAEWEGKGTIQENLKTNNASQQESLNYLKSLDKNLNHYKQFCENRGINPSLMMILNKAHERSHGDGAPKKVNWSELSDLENIIVFVCENIGLEAVTPDQNHLFKPFAEIVKGAEKISPRLKNILETTFENLNETEELLCG